MCPFVLPAAEHAICAGIGDGANDVGMIQAAHIGVGSVAGRAGSNTSQ